MGVGSSKKREQERLEKERKEKEEKFQKAKKDLQETISGMELKLEQLNAQAKSFHESAKKKLESGDREGARYLLSKKKKITEQIKNFNNALMMLDDQLITMENQEFLGGITTTIKKTTETIKNEMRGTEEIENIVKGIDDIKHSMNEFNSAIENIDEDNLDDIDVENEFEKLENDLMEEEFPDSNKEKLESNKKKDRKKKNMIEA